MLEAASDLIVQLELCTSLVVIGPGPKYISNRRGYGEGIKPIVYRITDAGIPAIPIQTWVSHITGRGGLHPGN